MRTDLAFTGPIGRASVFNFLVLAVELEVHEQRTRSRAPILYRFLLRYSLQLELASSAVLEITLLRSG
jgi:hypothetical protein